jgi:hypothetical protein
MHGNQSLLETVSVSHPRSQAQEVPDSHWFSLIRRYVYFFLFQSVDILFSDVILLGDECTNDLRLRKTFK